MPNDTATCSTNLASEKLDAVPITIAEFQEISKIQQEILLMVSKGQSQTTILVALCQLSESLLPNSVASIMIKDPQTGTMSVLAAPSIPQDGHDALANLSPGPTGGSCGNAVFQNKPQYVQNTFEDPRWESIRHIATDFNICSCWSMPIRDEEKNAIGSFALSSFEHRSPHAFHTMLLDVSAFIVGVVLRSNNNK